MPVLSTYSRIVKATGLICVLVLSACSPANRQAPEGTDVIVIGDSVMRWNTIRGASIGHVIARNTELSVSNLAVSGAVFNAASGKDIRGQYRPGPWDWVVMDGGANDLAWNCRCSECDTVLDGLVTTTGDSGAMADFARRVVGDGARVIVMGYYDGPEVGGAFSGCDEELTELNRRLALMARAQEGVWFVDTADTLDPADLGHYALDRVHPSATGSRLLGEQIAATINALGQR